jgi:hypothetical protein
VSVFLFYWLHTFPPFDDVAVFWYGAAPLFAVAAVVCALVGMFGRHRLLAAAGLLLSLGSLFVWARTPIPTWMWP